MSKYLVDVDDDLLAAVRAELSTATVEGTVNEALRRVSSDRARRIGGALDVLGAADFDDRWGAWRRAPRSPPAPL